MKQNKIFTMGRRIVLIFSVIAVIAMSLLPCASNAQEESIKVGSTTRTMIVYAPAGISKERPLMISMHGMNQDPAFQKNQSKWEEVADTAKFVVVYPRGINLGWDISGTSDINFILAIIDSMKSRYSIDKNRVYLSGFSMGGMMTYFAATKIADKIAAFAPVSGYLMGGPNTNSSRPIPIIHTHGTTDDVVGYGGAQTSLNAWITRNNCPTTAQITKPYPAGKTNSIATKSYWGPGTDGVEIVLLTLEGKGHWWSLDVAGGVHTSGEIWNFCKKFALDPGKPSVNFLSPAGNSEFSSLDSITITAAASDTDGNVACVTFYNGVTMLYTDSVAPYGFTIEKPSLGTYNLRAVVTDNEGKTDETSLRFTVVPPKMPILNSSVPEMNSFELPLSTDTFKFVYDGVIDCAKVKARMDGASGMFDLQLLETGFSKTLTFKRPAGTSLVDGEYSVTLYDIYNDKNIAANRNDVIRYAFGKLNENAVSDTLLRDGWKAENAIPTGWKVTYGTNVREQNTTQSSGPRILKFLAGGDFEYGMYLRDEGSISRFTYGTYEQSRLNLNPGIYSVSFFYSWWTAGTAQRNQKIHFAVLDLSGNVIFEQRDISTSHGFNENRNVIVAGSQKSEISFTIDKEQAYVLQWSTEQFGFDGAIVGGIKLISYPSVAAIASKYKATLTLALSNANQMSVSIDSSIYNGTQKTELLNAIATIAVKKMTAPSECQNAVTLLDAATKNMLAHKAAVDKALGKVYRNVSMSTEIKEIQYFNLNGSRIGELKKGLNIIRTIYKDGNTEVQKVLIK